MSPDGVTHSPTLLAIDPAGQQAACGVPPFMLVRLQEDERRS